MVVKLDEIATFVKEHILPLCANRHIFTFTGPLGAGKTTLISEILKQLGVKKAVTSPTFGYVKNYETPNKTSVHHFDLYRLNSVEDFVSAGFDEYLIQANSLIFIEWPIIINQLLVTKKIVSLSLEHHQANETMRIIKIVTS